MSESDRKPQSLLVADSDVLVRHALADYLRHCGYAVIEGATFEEAVLVLSNPDLCPEAVLTDAGLKGAGNGFALRQWVHEHNPGVRVILAGNIEAAAESAGLLCDEGPQLTRPYDPQMVVRQVRKALAARARAGR